MPGIIKPAASQSSHTPNTNDFGGLFSRLIAALMGADQRSRDMRTLESLDDSALKDIGISRQQRDQAFYGTYGRSPKDSAPTTIETRLKS